MIPAVSTWVQLSHVVCPRWDPPSRVVADQDLQKDRSGESQGSTGRALWGPYNHVGHLAPPPRQNHSISPGGAQGT